MKNKELVRETTFVVGLCVNRIRMQCAARQLVVSILVSKFVFREGWMLTRERETSHTYHQGKHLLYNFPSHFYLANIKVAFTKCKARCWGSGTKIKGSVETLTGSKRIKASEALGHSWGQRVVQTHQAQGMECHWVAGLLSNRLPQHLHQGCHSQAWLFPFAAGEVA